MIADAYDAMTSTRAYRKALPQDVAFQELRDKAGVQFHPACVEALIASIEARRRTHGDGFEREAEFERPRRRARQRRPRATSFRATRGRIRVLCGPASCPDARTKCGTACRSTAG